MTETNLTPAVVSFRERQLLDAFRQCDERGKRLIEQLANNQAAASAPPSRQNVADLHDIIAKLGSNDTRQLLGFAKGLESHDCDLQDLLGRLNGASLLELLSYARELLAEASARPKAQLQRVK